MGILIWRFLFPVLERASWKHTRISRFFPRKAAVSRYHAPILCRKHASATLRGLFRMSLATSLFLLDRTGIAPFPEYRKPGASKRRSRDRAKRSPQDNEADGTERVSHRTEPYHALGDIRHEAQSFHLKPNICSLKTSYPQDIISRGKHGRKPKKHKEAQSTQAEATCKNNEPTPN